ncbi:SDR family oxidoreductase [Pseudomaricurvus alkylphenolicus]|uniref:SDR family NAD(P)-dependent oxidoreductase n=1 Tax=Pseudomaricurvus alkylphenolicus TaxID=1306991 RepID=UPI0014243C8A|nr:glucose 1-dehydrogenase [Pseudomaricurvus alkylphenolicus]NIB44927.1 SDR family oxidoreductase [Pseudomaricurvus alkylphenolicus]
MSQYQDQVVLITGASGGLGREAALQFGQNGAKLALSDINADALEATCAELRDAGIEVFSRVCDVTDETQVNNFVNGAYEHYGRLDAAVNNAGIDPAHNLLADIPLDDYNRTMDINVKGVFLCMKAQIPLMQAQGGGAICNISSVAGVGAAPNMSVYAASKHAVLGLTKSAAHEYGKCKIRVNAVCPFITRTPMLDQSLELVPPGQREAMEKQLGKSAALKRIAEPAEVVTAILFACDKTNSFMTGHELMVDGGMSAL